MVFSRALMTLCGSGTSALPVLYAAENCADRCAEASGCAVRCEIAPTTYQRHARQTLWCN